ncbi:MAG: hypothetical protein GY859_17025 [Desulfobacterales bacterium]|nr:hypothetical protein [Desulfobacterales bacterium]
MDPMLIHLRLSQRLLARPPDSHVPDDNVITPTSAAGVVRQTIVVAITDANEAAAIGGEGGDAMTEQDPPPIQANPSP